MAEARGSQVWDQFGLHSETLTAHTHTKMKRQNKVTHAQEINVSQLPV
jgi:hypothetical protein